MADHSAGLLPTDVWLAIGERGVPRVFESGDVLMHHGSKGRSCYAIRSGQVLVSATSTQGALVVLGRLGPGQLVGEFAALEGGDRSATATAKTEVDTVRLAWQDLHAILHEHPDWAISLLQRMAGRIRCLSQRYSVRSEDLRVRIIDVLEVNHAETGDPVFKSTRAELAGWVGATREAVARSLQGLNADGVVTLRRGEVELLRPPPASASGHLDHMFL